MAFLNPLVLIGLAAAAIPLIIHLFNFRKPKRVDFSSLAFLRELEKRTMRRVRLKQWLLLLLRTMVIVCLVLAFARPTKTSVWENVFGDRAPTAMAVVIDNSLSMTMRDVQGAYIDQAKTLATTLLEGAQPGDELFVVPTAMEQDIGPLAFVSGESALDAVQELEPRPGTEYLSSALARAASLLEGASNPLREIFLIGDLQSTTLVDSTQAVVPEGIELTLMPLGDREHSNTAVTDVEITSRIIERGKPLQLSATVERFGDETEGYGASVFLDGERVAQTSIDLAERMPKTIPFTFTTDRRGWLQGEVRIEPDEAEWDDVRYFTFYVPQAQRVLVVRGTNARADMVSEALGVAAERGALDVTHVDENNLAAAGVENFGVVIIVGPEELSSGEVALLEGYVDAGGGLLMFVGEDPSAFNVLLSSLGGGAVNGFIGEVDGPSFGGFGEADLDHPLFEGVFDSAVGQPRLEDPEISQAGRYVRGGMDENTLINLGGGTPFLEELRHGLGSALLFTVAPDPQWSDYAMRGLFVPLLYRSVIYLAAADPGGTGSITAGEANTLRIDGIGQSEPVRLVGQNGDEWTPFQRRVPGGLLVEFDESISEPGVYDVMQNETLLRRVAINIDPRESDLATMDPSVAIEQLEEVSGRPIRLLNVSGGAGLAAAQRLGADRRGVELSSFFLGLALLFLLAEMLVAMRWKPDAGNVS